MRLERTSYAGLEASAPQKASTELVRVQPDEEKVSISAAALGSSAERPAPPLAEVRWYRAVRFGSGAWLAEAANDPRTEHGVVELARPKNPRQAVAAYLATMQAAA
ncbi:MAG TPA: hypothetical protein VMG32_06225 [Anaeromyxobacteraceae bacterium]|nr:hypothetical protein [Anaeromyxobacteraceae bacterium]